jgi:type III secretion protein J
MPPRAPRKAATVAATCAVFAWAMALFGCSREIAAGLEDAEANRGVVALSRSGIDAEKVSDPTGEGRFRLVVTRDDATAAIAVLSAEEIPRRRATSPKESPLVASAEADRASRVAETAAEIERSLASIDGILDARVLLDVPVLDPLAAALTTGDAKSPRASASVLLRHRGATPPLAVTEVKRLVSGAVSGLDPDAVIVVLVPVAAPATAAERPIAYLGPIAVARASLPTLRALAIGVLAVIAGLATVILFLAIRLRRSRDVTSAVSTS